MIPKRSVGVLAALVVLSSPLISVTSKGAERIVAYVVTAGTAGNQNFSGVIGMDFDVANPILVTQIGVFDDDSDGLQRPITARLYDRSDPAAPVAIVTMEFTPESPGTLIGGSRFKALPEPLRLEVGFQGTIAAENYGLEEQLKNFGIDSIRDWTVNDGNGSLAFVGTSRYGLTPGEYPDVLDGGPADRYCAGTFEFEPTAPLKPGAPGGLGISPGDKSISLSWTAVTNPLPAAKYEVWRASSPTGAFTKVGESTSTEYSESGLVNEQTYCYRIRGIGAGGQEGNDSANVCAAPYLLPTGQFVAYRVKAGVPGTQIFDGSVGMDFQVANAIVVTHLGVFDDGSDGLGRVITARLWDRSVPDAPTELASLEFTPENPGSPVGGSRFKPLPSPVRLEAGFLGTISAENYGAEERLFNSGGDPQNVRPWVIETANGSLKLTGSGRYGTTPVDYPATPDGGPADRYAAGTFQFQPTSLANPGIPDITVEGGDLSATVSWAAITEPVPAAKYQVLRGTAEGGLVQVAEVNVPTFTDSGLTKNSEYCYAVVAVSGAGKAGVPSARSCLTTEAREPGIAYIVEAGAAGSQAFGGALGMDFDVKRAIRVTRLGVFDDSSDGLFLSINARLYDRSTRLVVASLDFTPESSGDLIDGSRFKTLPQPVVLPTGFQGTMVASGYGADERNGNGIPGRTVFAGGGSLVFVGTARYGTEPADYPGTPDGGPANRYAAGSFYFEPAAEAPKVAIARSGSTLVITWNGGGTLESAPAVSGTWTAVPGATSGLQVQPSAAAEYYRVKQ